MVTVRPLSFFRRRGRSAIAGAARIAKFRPTAAAAARRSCDPISMVEKIALGLKSKRLRVDSPPRGAGQSVFGARVRPPPVLPASVCVCARACTCVRAGQSARTRCMPAGVIDIGKYAMADRSQRAGTNDCSRQHSVALCPHTVTYNHAHTRGVPGTRRLARTPSV